MVAQLRGLAVFVNDRPGQHGHGGGDESFLECRHGNSLVGVARSGEGYLRNLIRGLGTGPAGRGCCHLRAKGRGADRRCMGSTLPGVTTEETIRDIVNMQAMSF